VGDGIKGFLKSMNMISVVLLFLRLCEWRWRRDITLEQVTTHLQLPYPYWPSRCTYRLHTLHNPSLVWSMNRSLSPRLSVQDAPTPINGRWIIQRSTEEERQCRSALMELIPGVLAIHHETRMCPIDAKTTPTFLSTPSCVTFASFTWFLHLRHLHVFLTALPRPRTFCFGLTTASSNLPLPLPCLASTWFSPASLAYNVRCPITPSSRGQSIVYLV